MLWGMECHMQQYAQKMPTSKASTLLEDPHPQPQTSMLVHYVTELTKTGTGIV